MGKPKLESATEVPNPAPLCGSGATSFCSCDHVLPERLKMYAAPPRPFPSAPAINVLPKSDTEPPKRSPEAASAGTIFACWVQVESTAPDRVNTYTAPVSTFEALREVRAPMTIVFPDMATDIKTPLLSPVSDVVNLCRPIHGDVALARVNTSAVTGIVTAKLSGPATTSVSPSNAIDTP